jgi:hypothetical protein
MKKIKLNVEKLQLKKETITSLTEDEMNSVRGGDLALTTYCATAAATTSCQCGSLQQTVSACASTYCPGGGGTPPVSTTYICQVSSAYPYVCTWS